MRGRQLAFDFERHAAVHARLVSAVDEAERLLGRMRGRRAHQHMTGRALVERLRRTIPPHSAWETEHLPDLDPRDAAEARFEIALFPRWLDALDHLLDVDDLGAFRRRARALLALLRDHLEGEAAA